MGSIDERPVGLIIAGGRARRLGGGDKTLRMIAGRPLLAWIVERLAPQCTALILNANGAPARFAGFGLPLAPDDPRDREAGPLAGVLAGLEAAAALHPDRLVLTVAGDTPFLPEDLAARLAAARLAQAAPLAAARFGGRQHPLTALWPAGLRDALRDILRVDGVRRVLEVVDRLGVAWTDWPEAGPDPFLNVNTPEDLAAARRRAEAPAA